MIRFVIVACALTVATIAYAHRLDECLQAMRVSVSRESIQFELTITPPHNAAEQFKQVLDDDGDGTISEKDVQQYFKTVETDLGIALSGKPLKLKLSNSHIPRSGRGRSLEESIQIEFTAAMTNLSAGAHQLTLTNHHLPKISVYQVNAVTPTDKSISLTKQTRNETQSEYRLEFEVASTPPRTDE